MFSFPPNNITGGYTFCALGALHILLKAKGLVNLEQSGVDFVVSQTFSILTKYHMHFVTNHDRFIVPFIIEKYERHWKDG